MFEIEINIGDLGLPKGCGKKTIGIVMHKRENYSLKIKAICEENGLDTRTQKILEEIVGRYISQ